MTNEANPAQVPALSEGLGPVPRWWHCDTHGAGNHRAWGCPECVRELRTERNGLMQTLRDEIDENLRLRELGGAGPDENITAMTERLIRERNALRAQLAIAARGLKHCAGWNINDDKRNALMAVVLESEAMLAPGLNVGAKAQTRQRLSPLSDGLGSNVEKHDDL
jgi:hypothetical protein